MLHIILEKFKIKKLTFKFCSVIPTNLACASLPWLGQDWRWSCCDVHIVWHRIPVFRITINKMLAAQPCVLAYRPLTPPPNHIDLLHPFGSPGTKQRKLIDL